jgi:hypothetical protein
MLPYGFLLPLSRSVFLTSLGVPGSDNSRSIELTYSQFLDEVDAGSITDVVIKGKDITGQVFRWAFV